MINLSAITIHTRLLMSENSDRLQCMQVLAAESGTHTGESSRLFCTMPPAIAEKNF